MKIDDGKRRCLERRFWKGNLPGRHVYFSSRLVERNDVETKLETRPVTFKVSINLVNSLIRER